MSTVEELQAKLAEIEKERDEVHTRLSFDFVFPSFTVQLKNQLSVAKALPYKEWTLRQRTSIGSIVSRDDEYTLVLFASGNGTDSV